MTQGTEDGSASAPPCGDRPLAPDGRAFLDAPCTNPCPEQSRPYVLAATVLASAMAFIDASVVTIALPSMQSDLAASFGALQWVVNAYALFLGGLILIGGGAGDRIGRRRVFLVGIVIFAVASIVCAIAPTIEVLIAGRALKGVGAALLVPQSLAIIAASFPKEVRGRAIGTWSGASAITTAVGPAVGGLLIETFGWRSIFWINLPFCLVAAWLTIRHVGESRDESVPGKLDVAGGFLSIAAFGLLTVALTRLAEPSNTIAGTAAMALVGLALLALFVRHERRNASPLVPMGLFENRAFTGANLITVFLYGGLAGITFLLPFDLIERRDMTASAVGLTLLPLGLIIGVLSGRAGSLGDRLGARPLLMTGPTLVAGGAAGLGLGIGGYWTAVLIPILILATGMALVVAPLTTAVMNAAPDEKSGAASGINNAASRLAGLFAVALLGALATFVFQGTPASQELDSATFGTLPDADSLSRESAVAAFNRAYSLAMWVVCSWCLLAAALAATLLPAKPDRQ